MKEIIEKYAQVNHRTKVYPMISKNTGVGKYTITQRWFNEAKGIFIPEKHRKAVIEVLDLQLKFQELEKKHYNSFFM